MREAAWMPQQVAPTYLDGSLGGDNGFDPLCLVPLGRRGVDINGLLSKAEREAKAREMSAEDLAANVQWMREAEVKHARLAMLAVVGWPLAELLNPLSLLKTDGRAPALFNGGLGDGPIAPFLILAAGAAAYLELQTKDRVNDTAKPNGYIAGDLGFDPLGFFGQQGAYAQKKLRANELNNGRLAMLAITGFAVQEFIWQEPVVDQTPFFFGR